ncbi:MAG: UDP-N-acetylmuramoyl-tripeptide--D-alanyl-D-alanine ligase [Spirochaetia bacterium]|nr:UDP-N-acetylmuramoyl-tripeptide--D-alanyl-D-alanine ligase [Spirochaetia bacterium]
MPSYTYENLVSSMHCIAAAPPSGWKAEGVSTDTRTMDRGCLFFALSGDRFDAHNYLDEAVGRGASGIVIEKNKKESCLAFLNSIGPEICIFEVDDVLKSLQSLASWHRRRIAAPVIAVTGSSGKTSAKEMLLTLIESSGKKAGGTTGNLNNHIGLPLTLANLDEDCDYIVLEMGMNHPGEISLLSRIARPDLSLITSVSGAHIGFFNSVEEILSAKLEITEGMDENGLLVYCASSGMQEQVSRYAENHKIRCLQYALIEKISADRMPDEYGENLQTDLNGIQFSWRRNTIKNSNYFSREMAENLLGCMIVMEKAGMKFPSILENAQRARPLTEGRFQVFRKLNSSGNLSILIDDSYNANGDSFCKAISALRRILPEGKLLLISGEMAELGNFSETEHARVGIQAGLEKYDLVIASGSENATTLLDACSMEHPDGRTLLAENREEIIRDLKQHLKGMDGILVKGSRSAGMDLVCQAIKEMGYV